MDLRPLLVPGRADRPCNSILGPNKVRLRALKGLIARPQVRRARIPSSPSSTRQWPGLAWFVSVGKPKPGANRRVDSCRVDAGKHPVHPDLEAAG